jgi:polar amino acid transport system substrate-binding protein
VTSRRVVVNIKMMRAAALAGGLALALTACGDDDGDTTDTGDGDTPDAADLALIDDGVLTVCSDLPYAVFEFEDADAPSGYSGFDIDLVQEMADRLELDLEVIVTSFDAIESGAAMAADQCDLAASAMTITEERAANIAFSDPYFETGQSLLVPTGSDATTLADFGGLTLGVQGATTGEDYATENAPEGTEIVGMPDDPTLRQAIEGGTIQGILQDFDTNLTITDELEGYEIAEVYDTGEEYGFGMKVEGQEALLEQVNELLADMRGDGTYDEIHSRYFSAD